MDLPSPRVRIQQESRLRKWMNAHPEHRSAVTRWLATFRANPFDPALEPLEHPNRHQERLFEYVVADAPLVVMVIVARYEDTTGVRWARVVFPRGPDDVTPDR